MKHYTRLAMIVLLTVLQRAHCDLDVCEDGYQIANKYSDCWTQESFANKQYDLYQPRAEYTGKFVEDYAKHMCSVVKPHAIECLRREMSDCSNIEKIVEMADESGGTCVHNNLNSFFKLHIIDHLAPVKNDSLCFTIADSSNCYNNAAKRVKQKGASISKFHYEADKFFAYIWDCQVKLFKSKSDICKNWQLPMLLSLQTMAMPTLFGMKLTDDHVAMLELENVAPTQKTPFQESPEENKFYILLKVLTRKPETVDGGVVLQVNIGDSPGDDKNTVKQIRVPDSARRKDKANKAPKGKKEKTAIKDIDNSDSQMIS